MYGKSVECYQNYRLKPCRSFTEPKLNFPNARNDHKMTARRNPSHPHISKSNGWYSSLIRCNVFILYVNNIFLPYALDFFCHGGQFNKVFTLKWIYLPNTGEEILCVKRINLDESVTEEGSPKVPSDNALYCSYESIYVLFLFLTES